jgi:hypothetical protein
LKSKERGPLALENEQKNEIMMLEGTRIKLPVMNKFKITLLKKSILNQNVVTFLSLQDALKLGMTCKLLFKNIIEEVQVDEAEYRITKIGIFDIPENIFPILKYLARQDIKLHEETSYFESFLFSSLNYNIYEQLQQPCFSKNRLKLFYFLKTLMNQRQEPFDIKSIDEDSEMEGVYNIHVFGKTIDTYDFLVLPLCVLIKKFQFEFHIMATEQKYRQRPLIDGISERAKNKTWISVKKIDKNDDRWTLCYTRTYNDTPIQREIDNNITQNTIDYNDFGHVGKGFILKICFE